MTTFNIKGAKEREVGFFLFCFDFHSVKETSLPIVDCDGGRVWGSGAAIK